MRTKQVPIEEKIIKDVGDGLGIQHASSRTTSLYKPYPQGKCKSRIPRNTTWRMMKRINNAMTLTNII